ncbi:PREDICTED: spermatid-specific linker histone H1-like protein [Chinchilla lanigera]|uniref:spermatid-specific linker histone H1-like protein n=1 Tax=Chinchilla lanigera TaxID=34839 RepID=UPI00038ECC91|nr:PREDICTED: spermatid-specific linker histone H1-like protein [Chinchilla lanigera]
MQSNSEPPPPPEPEATTSTTAGGRQASTTGLTSKSETGHGTKEPSKPSISKVILRTMADKGMGHLVSLNTLKNAVATTGYNMIRNTWRFKRALKKLVEQGMLRQVTGKGALGSFCLGKKSSKPKLKTKRSRRRRRRRQRRAGQRRAGQRRAGQRRQPRQHGSQQRRSLLGSKQGHKRLLKGVRRVAKQRRN